MRRWRLLLIPALCVITVIVLLTREPGPPARQSGPRGPLPADMERNSRPAGADDNTSMAEQGRDSGPNGTADDTWTLEVELRGEDRAPVAGWVVVVNDRREILRRSKADSARTHAFEVQGRVSVIAGGNSETLVPALFEDLTPPPTGTRTLVADLRGGDEIVGTVVDEAGYSIRFDESEMWGTQVTATMLGVPWWLRPSPTVMGVSWDAPYDVSTTVEKDGRFRFSNLFPGEYAIRIDRRSFKAVFSPLQEQVIARTGRRDVVLACRNPVVVHVVFVDRAVGKPFSSSTNISWQVAMDGDDPGAWQPGGHGSVDASGMKLVMPAGATFTLTLEAEGYLAPDPVAVVVRRGLRQQDVEIVFTPDAGGRPELELIVRDETGNPAFPLMLGWGYHFQRYSSRDGRYILEVPAGRKRIELSSPGDQILLFKPEWMPSMYGPEAFRPTRAYLPLDVDVDLPGGGRVTREVTLQRAALIWARQEPKDAFGAVRLLRDGEPVEHPFWYLYEEKGLVAAVEPGGYVVEGRLGEKADRVEVRAEAATVKEVWLRAERAE